MYIYRICLLFLYFYNFRKTFGTTEEQQANTAVTYELKYLEEHGHTTPQSYENKVKHVVFQPPVNKPVNQVQYDGVPLWTKSTEDGKVFKKLEAYEKANLLQLVHLTFTKGDAEEHLYYKKVKGAFEKLESETVFNQLLNTLKTRKDEYVDSGFPLDLHKKDLYSKFYTEKLEMVDGVWRRTLNLSNGKPFVARDGSQELWKLATENKQLGNVKEFDFGDEKKLLELTLYGGEKKYFSKLGTSATTWTLLADGEFDTKVTELKSKFFGTEVEYDVAVKPDLEKFVLQLKSDVGNSNDLNLFPVRNYRVSKVKFGNADLWTAAVNEERVFKLRLYLLGYEVHLVQLFVVKNPTSVEVRPSSVLYFYKEGGAFKTVNKNQYQQAQNKVKAAADRTKPFVYRNDWVATNATFDLTKYNPAEWTVADQDLTNGLLKKTLTPKEGLTFTSFVYLGQAVMPSTNRPYVDLLLKTVDVYFKKGLLQLVHVNGTKTVEVEGKSVNQAFELHLKKDRDDLFTVTKEEFDKYVELLKGADYFADNFVHLDLGDENLNTEFFTVTKDFVDGANKKEVRANGVKVTKLTHNNFEFWRQTQQYKDKHVTHFELFELGDAKMLSVHYNTVASQVLSREHFEKRDKNTEWSELTRPFNETMNSYKGVSGWQEVELDVGTKPLTDVFKVTVNRLKGSRTELVLKPLWQKRLTKVKLGDTALWTAEANNRVFAVHMYLERYEAKFLVLDVTTDGRLNSTTNTKVKKLKGDSGFVADEAFDTKLETFKTEDNGDKFTYNANWQLPLSDFDLAKFQATDFEVTVTLGLVETRKYVPKPGTLVKKVLFDGVKVWPAGDENTTRKLVFLEVFSKDNLVQLLKLHNNLVEGASTPEDLYFKKVKDTFEKVELEAFTDLKNSLDQPNKYVDDNVKLDLSGEVSTDLFKTESTLEDGLEKEVLELKVGKLYEVKASPPLWTSKDGSYVTKLEKYTLPNSQLLVLHVTSADGAKVTKEYFEKPLTPAAPAPTTPEQPAPAPEQARQEGQERPAGESGTETPAESPTGPAPEKPSFSTVSSVTEFFKKLNKAKETLTHEETLLNLNAYKDETKFRVLESDYGRAKLYKLYPLAKYWVTQLKNGETKLWEKTDAAYKMVEAWVFLHDAKVKFVKVFLWPKERVDETKDTQLYFKLDLSTNAYFKVEDKAEFEKALEEGTKVVPEPLPLSTGGMLPTKTREYRKLFLAENVDNQLFETRSEKVGEYTKRQLNPKANVFVNLLETAHGVLWKAQQTTQLWKGALFTFKTGAGHADLTLTENTVDFHKYYKFENSEWKEVNKEAYDKLHAKVTPTEPVVPPAGERQQQGAGGQVPSGTPVGGQQLPPAAPPAGPGTPATPAQGGSSGTDQSGGADTPAPVTPDQQRQQQQAPTP